MKYLLGSHLNNRSSLAEIIIIIINVSLKFLPDITITNLQINRSSSGLGRGDGWPEALNETSKVNYRRL